MVTLDQVDWLVREMSEEDQRGLIERVSQRLARVNRQVGGVRPEEFLRMCLNDPAHTQGVTDSAETVRGIREERASQL
jgi:hypothetical protein